MTAKRALKFLYDLWMRFAKVLGRIQTTIILFFIYFIGVGSVAIVSFLFRKDFLDKRLDDRPTFWHDRESKIPTLEDCKRQF